MTKNKTRANTKSPPRNTILHGDCLEHMAKLPPECVDLVFADPPYNLQLQQTLRRPNQSEVRSVDEDWDKFASLADYDRFTRDWLRAVRRVLSPDGALWVIGSYHNIFRIGAILQELDFWILNDVVWRKSNPMPNFRGRRFTNAHETLIWACRAKGSRYVFNYGSLKALNDDLQMRSDWYLPICNGHERLRDEDGVRVHPTQKPESLLYRIILGCSRPGQLVLDPFLGSGTTAVVARRLGRDWLGIESDSGYVAAARERLAATRPVAGDEIDLVAPVEKRDAPRVPFGLLLEHGLLRAGDMLSDPSGRIHARVRADGTLVARGVHGDVCGSIHQVGAAVQGVGACNGWNFWCVAPRDGRGDGAAAPVVLDVLRQRIRASREGSKAKG